MDLKLAGASVAVTGAARGLGRAVAQAFLREGARVLSVDRSFESGPPEVSDPDRHHRAVVDISTEAGAASIPNLARELFGGLDILVLNAGRHSSEALAALSANEFDDTFRTNVLGAAFVLKEFAKELPQGGAVVIIGSTATKSVQVNEFTYRASKFALRALAGSAALEFADVGVRVNIVTPGAIATGFVDLSLSQRERVLAEIPIGRESTPSEVAEVIMFVASPVCSYMTGAEIVVDGGLSMRPIR